MRAAKILALLGALLMWPGAIALEITFRDTSDPMDFAAEVVGWLALEVGVIALLTFIALKLDDVRRQRPLAGPVNRSRLP